LHVGKVAEVANEWQQHAVEVQKKKGSTFATGLKKDNN
jgi:hypothetical protein